MFHVKHYYTNNYMFEKIIDMLYEENLLYNLSGIKEKEAMYEQHIVDSLELSNYLKAMKNKPVSVVDIGSGAGFPGLVLAVENPDKDVWLVESNKKKSSFSENVARQLSLKNVFVYNDRIERLNFNEDKDIVCAKALASLDVLLEYASPLLKIGGLFVAMKSSETSEEFAEAKSIMNLLGFRHLEDIPYLLSGKKRHLVVFLKAEKAKIELPRKIGDAKNKPLRSKVCV
jgi:16S rRNA (guanine527-N7)-methyltransferase